MMQQRLLHAIFGVWLFAGLALGCGESFEPYWRVEGYRILGVKSEPVTLKPGEATEVSVLDHVPEGESVSYEWSWCPVTPSAQQNYDCPLDDLQQQADRADAGEGDAGGGGQRRPKIPLDSKSFELGEGPTARLPYPGTAEQVLGICRQIRRAVAEAGQSSNLTGSLPTANCKRGYDVSVRLRAETDSGTVAVAKKDLTLWTGGKRTNQNPTHAGIEIRVADVGDIAKARERLDWVPAAGKERAEQWVAVSDDEPLPILAGMTFQIRALVDKESAEEYRPPVPEGSDRKQMPLEREALSFRWFASQGDLEHAKRIYAPKQNTVTTARRTGLTVDGEIGRSCATKARDVEKCRAALYSVVRDGRLGLDFARAQLQVVGVVE